MTPPASPQPDLPAAAQQIRVAAFWAIFDGIEATPGLLAQHTCLSLSEVTAALALLDARGAITRDRSAGTVTGSHGLSAVPAAYALTLAGRARSVWCAEDAVGIPVALGFDAAVDGRCAVCAVAMPISIKAGAVVRPGFERVWLSEAAPGSRMRDTL